MNTELTCGTCCHYDAIQSLCSIYTVDLVVGEVYLKRLPESPACTSRYFQKVPDKTVAHPMDSASYQH